MQANCSQVMRDFTVIPPSSYCIAFMVVSMPGFQAGRFRLRGKLAKAFCVATDRQRVLWLPLHHGKDQLLLSVERPQELLDALRDAQGARARRARA